MVPQENLTCDSIQAYLYGDRARFSEATFPSHPASTNFRLLPPSGNESRKPLDHATGSVGDLSTVLERRAAGQTCLYSLVARRARRPRDNNALPYLRTRPRSLVVTTRVRH
jgi:hypothetical protein